MRNNSIKAFALLVIIGLSVVLCSWGVWGHQHINRAAVFALPSEMRLFFYNHIDFITEESTVPDLRKYTMNDKDEGPRHFLDPELFVVSIDSLPLTSKSAHQLFHDSVLQKNGTLPWHIQDMMDKLTQAFRNRRKTEILFLAADLGHYLGDAHMPLHTTYNHDGQLTGQRGVHALWESHLPEMYGENYDLNIGTAAYIADITGETWKIIKNSHFLADSLLAIELRLKKSMPEKDIYVRDSSGAILKNKFNQPVHTHTYAQEFHEALHGMVEKQMRSAISATANYWYTAWVNAGKPDLSSLDDKILTVRNNRNYKKDMKSWEKGKIRNLKSETEF